MTQNSDANSKISHLLQNRQEFRSVVPKSNKSDFRTYIIWHTYPSKSWIKVIFAKNSRKKLTCINFSDIFSFGVCCLFLVSASGSTVSQNCTYIRNPSFPNVYPATTSITYTIQKCTSGKPMKNASFERTFKVSDFVLV